MQFPMMCFKLWRCSIAAAILLLFVIQVASANSPSNHSLEDRSSNSSSYNKAELDRAVSLVESKKFAEAFTLFKKMAEAGDPEAQHNLAMLYRAGKGVEKNLEKSAHWFREAADQGVSDAQYYLGYMYDTGEGVTQNYQYAVVWYHKAAEHGQGQAQINLGVLYANGLGVKQDVEQAYLWFHVAAAQGYNAAFENRKILEEAMEPVKVEELRKKGYEYFRKYVLPYQRHSSSYPQLR